MPLRNLQSINSENKARFLSMHAMCCYLCVTVTNWDLHRDREQWCIQKCDTPQNKKTSPILSWKRAEIQRRLGSCGCLFPSLQTSFTGDECRLFWKKPWFYYMPNWNKSREGSINSSNKKIKASTSLFRSRFKPIKLSNRNIL